MKKWPIILTVAVIVILVILAYFLIKTQEAPIYQVPTLSVENFQYTYDSMVSHVCPGIEEEFVFTQDGVEFEIIAQDKTLAAGRGNNIEDYPDCVDIGTPVGYEKANIFLKDE